MICSDGALCRQGLFLVESSYSVAYLTKNYLLKLERNKLATLLATEVIENEYQWLNYDFEEAQVRIDLGDMILEHLVTEAISLSDKIEENPEEQSIYKAPIVLVNHSDDEDNETKSKTKSTK